MQYKDSRVAPRLPHEADVYLKQAEVGMSFQFRMIMMTKNLIFFSSL